MFDGYLLTLILLLLTADYRFPQNLLFLFIFIFDADVSVLMCR